MYLKNAWYVAGWNAEFGQDALVTRRLLGEDVVFYRRQDGALVALEDRCCHRAAPLSKGQQEGDQLRCMYHGLLFDCSGRCVEVPGQDRISDKLRVRSYPVAVRDNLVWIWMGVAADANVDDIQHVHWHNRDGWDVEEGGYLHYASGTQLIVDNLLDFSHLAFVHNQSIGTRKQGNVRPETEFSDESVSVRFTTLNGEAPAFARQLSQLPDDVDRFNYYVWHIRGNLFVQDSVIAPVGDGYESADPRTMKLHTFIALTPCDQTSTHYFWATARNHFTSSHTDLTRRLTEQVAHAFDEDRQIIEAQQAVLSTRPQAPMIPIAADATLYTVRRMLDSLLDAEQTRHAVN
ncbi:MAG: Rieske 2Fe-2S domain-containing protein [Janthinobacterium lividum]